jgi:hypothetical protein
MKNVILMILAAGGLAGCIQQRAEPLGNCLFICNLEQSQMDGVPQPRQDRIIFK